MAELVGLVQLVWLAEQELLVIVVWMDSQDSQVSQDAQVELELLDRLDGLEPPV